MDIEHLNTACTMLVPILYYRDIAILVLDCLNTKTLDSVPYNFFKTHRHTLLMWIYTCVMDIYKNTINNNISYNISQCTSKIEILVNTVNDTK